MLNIPRPPMRSLEEVFGSGSDGSEAFENAVDESLSPRGLDPLLFDLVDDLGMPLGAKIVDIGAREGRYTVELARYFGATVRGVEPVGRHLQGAAQMLEGLARDDPQTAALVRVDEGVAADLIEGDGSVDLVWCRDVLQHIDDVAAVFAEFRRVLRPDGHVVMYQITTTPWLTAQEAGLIWPPLGVFPASVDPDGLAAAIASSGLVIDECIDLYGEQAEWHEETRDGAGIASRRLISVSRMLRNRDAYVAEYGAAQYEITLADRLWGIYQLIGKLNPRVYVLSVA